LERCPIEKKVKLIATNQLRLKRLIPTLAFLCKVTQLEPQLGSTFKRHAAQKPNLMTSRITARENQGKYLDFLLIISIGGKLHRLQKSIEAGKKTHSPILTTLEMLLN